MRLRERAYNRKEILSELVDKDTYEKSIQALSHNLSISTSDAEELVLFVARFVSLMLSDEEVASQLKDAIRQAPGSIHTTGENAS